MRALPIPWSAEELEQRYRAATDAATARRTQALWLRGRGQPAGRVAAAVGVSTETLRAWVRRATAEGLDALTQRKPGSGAKPKLDAAQQQRVLAWADAEPHLTLHGLAERARAEWGIAISHTQSWADAEPHLMLHGLAERARAEWGIAISHTQSWALLRRGGFRRVVPRKRHYRADPAAQAAAQKNRAPWPATWRASPGRTCSSPTRRGGG